MTDRPAPIFVSVKDAATMLGLTPWGADQLLDEQRIESRYCGRQRLVVVESLIEYAANLPTPVVA
jgi:hypothetical protein